MSDIPWLFMILATCLVGIVWCVEKLQSVRNRPTPADVVMAEAFQRLNR